MDRPGHGFENLFSEALNPYQYQGLGHVQEQISCGVSNSFKRKTGADGDPYEVVEIISNNLVKITDGKSSLKQYTIDLPKFITRPTRKNKSEDAKVLPSEGKKPSSASKTSKGEGLENLTVKKESRTIKTTGSNTDYRKKEAAEKMELKRNMSKPAPKEKNAAKKHETHIFQYSEEKKGSRNKTRPQCRKSLLK